MEVVLPNWLAALAVRKTTAAATWVHPAHLAVEVPVPTVYMMLLAAAAAVVTTAAAAAAAHPTAAALPAAAVVVVPVIWAP